MIKKLLALALALTMCFGTTITANAAMNISNEMGALNTLNILDKNSSKIPKGTLQYMASKFKIEYTQEDLKALKKIFDANLYAKAYPDVAAAYGNDREALWNHYVTHGINEGRTQINSGFNVFAYISAYPDLRNAFGDDLVAYYVHYANNGINENRKLITVDAATRAGITVTGLQGQVIARPAPIQVPDLSAYSVPGGVLDTDQVKETPEATTKPTETPKPSETPSPSVTPTPTPVSPTEEPGCNHIYTIGEPIEDMPHMHYAKCQYCGEYAIREDGSKLPLECRYENSVCRDCKRPCNHDNCDGMRQIEGTTEHAPICRVCRGVDIANKAACWTDANGYEITETTHQKKCHDCGGAMEEIKSHLYTNYEPIIAEDRTPVHSGKCECGAEDVSEHQYAEGSSVCSVCGYECTSIT